jgi:cobalt-precorrin 5A hydrolase/precorrin-3B C17-methyltransferase
MIGLVAVTPAGRLLADRLATAWPGGTVVHSGPAGDQLRSLWSTVDGVVCFLATGATVRLIAPLLAGKHTDPGVVCVDEAGRFAVALCGGHAGGANGLAQRVAAVLGAEPVITTASDAVGVTALDTYGADLGFRLADPGAVAKASATMLGGAPVAVHADAVWPLPALPEGSGGSQPVTLAVSDRLDATGDVVYRPPSLVVGVGASRGVPAAEVAELVDGALADAGLAADSVRCLATVDLKVDEEGIRALAGARGWPIETYPAADLSTVDVPNPSEVVRAAVGTRSVAEAAALRAAGRAGRAAALVVPKRASAMATVAVARLTPRGRLTLVGLGPGAEDLRAPRAVAALRRASVVVGLDRYVVQILGLLTPGTRVIESGLGAEEERAATAVRLATEGHAVALIGSGDAGIYAMASPALELAGPDVDVVAVPGITAAVAAAARLGAPLGHDHAYLSLSDLHTPWEVIAGRVAACAAADLVVCLYNPRSRARQRQFAEAVEALLRHRGPDTPVGVVRDATRPGERVTLTTLGGLDESTVDMLSVVIVGSSRTRVVAGRMVTPREYRWLQ